MTNLNRFAWHNYDPKTHNTIKWFSTLPHHPNLPPSKYFQHAAVTPTCDANRMWHKFSALHHFSRRTSTVFSRSLVFNLITVYTPVLLLAGSIVTSAKQILSPIHCEGEGKDGLSKDYVETYCYIEGTFNLYMKQAEQQVRPKLFILYTHVFIILW